jgi:hypothetical protein
MFKNQLPNWIHQIGKLGMLDPALFPLDPDPPLTEGFGLFILKLYSPPP